MNTWIHSLKLNQKKTIWSARGYAECYNSELEWVATGRGVPPQWSFDWQLELLKPKESRFVELLILDDEPALKRQLTNLLNTEVGKAQL